MSSNSSPKSKALIWLQLIIGLIIFAWLSYDFFHTFVNGVTYKLRFDDTFDFSNNRVAFVIAVAIKLAVYSFFIWLIRDCFRQLKK